MASSGSVDFSLTRDNMIARAFEMAGIINEGGTPSSTQLTIGAQLLNMAVKQWSGTADFSGQKMQSRKRAYLFLSEDNAIYTLGPTTTQTGTTNKWASSYVTTTLSAAEAASQTVISLTSITGISDTDRIGIELDDGTIHWSVVSGSPSAGTATIANALASAAASGNRVFTYATTNQGRRPLSILTASLRSFDSNNVPSDVPINAHTILERYEANTSKATDSDPSEMYYEATLTDGTAYLNYEPSDVAKIIRCVYLSPIEDFDAAGDTPDFSQEWYLPFVIKLGMLTCINYRMPITQDMKDAYGEALTIARNLNPETSELYFQCNA